MPHRVLVDVVGLSDRLGMFSGIKTKLICCPCGATRSHQLPSLRACLSSHTHVFALYFSCNPFYPGGETREKKGANVFNFETSDQTTEICSNWKSEEIKYECCSVEVMENTALLVFIGRLSG